MSCNISSESFNDPYLKEVLQKLSSYFNSINSDFYVIGATARNIIMSSIHNRPAGRSTSDLDIAIAINDWDKFKQISTELVDFGFEKSKKQNQEFSYKNGYTLDVVPFGNLAKADKNIYWPPEGDIAMSILGFSEVANNALTIIIDNEFSIKVASLHGIFILKLVAFNDRKFSKNKDADDMAFIIANYLDIYEMRVVEEHYDLYEIENFTPFIAGAALLGRDIKDMLQRDKETLESISKIIETESELEDGSILINQMLETNKSLKYEETLEALQMLLQELKK